MNTTQAFLLQLFSWQALLDICLITAGFFFLYRTLSSLGTSKIFIGICIAFALFATASIFNLEGVKWIFRNISQVAVLAMIVIFQPELRKFFEKLVSLYHKGNRQKGLGQDISTIIAESVWRMAEQRCGALLVFPGHEAIDDKLSGGFELDAKVSIPLLLSIFDHHTPGHDGAVIVQNGKLNRFGVRLPISVSGRLSNDYGTRHHAGMGLSEQSDALILVVSEERGKISLFARGSMRTLNSAGEVKDALARHDHKNGLTTVSKGIFTDRWALMQLGLCLVIAMVFWFSLIVVNKQIVERVISLPVEYTAPETGLVLVGDKIDRVKVHVTGTVSDLDSLAASHTAVQVTLGDMVEGKNSVLISEENLRLPRHITLLGSDPDRFEVSLAGIVRKAVPVTPQLIGKLPIGKKIKAIKMEPEMVQVLAPPDREGHKTTNISTTPIYLNSVDSTSTLFCKIVAPPAMQPVDRKWPDVKVTIEIEEQ